MVGRQTRVVVVGAGIGGLACAIDLAALGHEVRVLERFSVAGGKARAIRLGSAAVDAGPTVLTMPWVFDELFENAGASFRSALPLERPDIVARHTWSGGTSLDLHSDVRASADAIGSCFGAAEARAYIEFCADAKGIYEFSEQPFLRSQRMGLAGLVQRFGAAGLSAFARIDCHRSMARALEARFAEPRLRQLFGRYATYCGCSPYEAPATLNLIAHVENAGVYRVRSGMSGLVAALAELARSLGVEILHDHRVDRIVVERGRVAGVIARGELHEADRVVFNGDISALGAGLLGEAASRSAKPTPRGLRSLSAVTWALVARTRGAPLVHHNVFFSDDYRAEFDALLCAERVPADPTIYVCAQDRASSDDGIDGAEERLLVLVNAPATGDRLERWSESEKHQCSTAMTRRLQALGLTLEPTQSVVTTPREFHQLFPGTGGALYGPRSRGGLSVLARQGARTKIRGLYLAGGSVHPGPGVPMSALSGRLAALRICEDLASTVRSPRAVTTGTISTASATTADRRS